MSEKLYYLQDIRTTVGNSMLWWAKDHKGYTCDIRKAHIFTELELSKIHLDTNVPWLKDYIDARVSHHVDFQHCDRDTDAAIDEAMKGGA